MARVAITDGDGAWFNISSAERYDEKTYWNGSNHISKATGSQLEHECLFLTKVGKFILNHWSQCQGGVETYKLISKSCETAWFVIQEFSDDEIPEILKDDVLSLEIK